MNGPAEEPICAAASSLNSIATASTGKVGPELSTMGALLAETKVILRGQALTPVQGVAEVRKRHLMGPTPEPIGDGNRQWRVFSAVRAIRQYSLWRESSTPMVFHDSEVLRLEL